MLRVVILALFVCAALAFPQSLMSGAGMPLCGGYYDSAKGSATIVFLDGEHYENSCEREACQTALGFLSGFLGASVDVVQIGQPLAQAFARREKFAALAASDECGGSRYSICGRTVCIANNN